MIYCFIVKKYNKISATPTNTGFKSVADSDSLNWKYYGVDSIIKSVVENKHLGNGSIILMHNGAKYTPEALEMVLTGLQNKGYEISAYFTTDLYREL